MGLSCECDYEGDDGWYYFKTDDFKILETSRRKRCTSCKALIDIGAECVEFPRSRSPRTDIEDRIYGDEVPLASKYMCEACGGLYFALDELGYCITLGGENMRDLVREYNEIREADSR